MAWRITIRGRVQGVGYRDAMVDAAQVLGVTGWVRNRYDGTVEAQVQGDEAALERLLAWCRRGPPASHVSVVDTQDIPADASLRTFERRPSAP